MVTLLANPQRFTDAAPYTALDRMHRDMERVWIRAAATNPSLGEDLLALMRSGALLDDLDREVPALVKQAERVLRRDPRAPMFMRLVAEAEARVPRAGIVLVTYNPESAFVSLLDVGQQATRAGRTREDAARAGLVAIQILLEGPYRTYLRALWMLDCARKGVWKEPPEKVGVVANGLISRLKDLPGLFDERLVKMRNAIAHRSFTYDVTRDEIVAGKNHAGERWSTDEIMEAATQALTLSLRTMPDLVGLYFIREVLVNGGALEWVRQRAPLLMSDDAAAAAAAEAEVTAAVVNELSAWATFAQPAAPARR